MRAFRNSKFFKFFRFKERAIARDITISLFLLVIIVEGSLLAFIYWKQAQLLLQELENKADDYANYLSEILAVPIWDYDDEQIETIVTGFAKNILVDELHIMNSERQSLYSYQDSNTSKTRIKRSIIINYKGKPIGFAELFLSLDVYKANLAWFRNSIISVLIGSLIVILIATGFLLRHLMRNPIIILQKGIDRVAKGEYAYEFNDVHHKELSGIATRIKEMALIIQKREIALQGVNKELKHEISTRKKEAAGKLRLEKKLQQASKMEAIGTLAGGVAHDLNNILSGIVSYPELLLMDISRDSPLRKPLLTIKQSGEKAAEIVQNLLTLARRGVAVTEVVNLNHTISEYMKSPEHEQLLSFHPNTKIEANFKADLLNIMGSPIHLTKTVMNLISNAAEAIIEDGEIIISTRNQYIDKPVRGYDGVREGDYVVLNIADDGIGISPEDMERIFEPFYTKKIMGRSGSGLGMAVVWGAVKDHNGYIDVQSKEGKGTSFTLYFPVTRKKRAKGESLLPIEEYMGKGESVLVVDDVEEQREIATGMLRKLGYSITSVSSGEEAVEYMKYTSADLIVLDMIMEPGINGRETYERIIDLHPDQKAIIASGFSETEDVKVAQALGAGLYIKKPYTLEKIGIAVRDELKK
jgi:two-component system cell cycle sensor histidine kinase/response regulator CckA